MKIVYNIRSTANSGGMERMLCVKANWLVNAGYEVVVITTDQQGRPPFFEFDSRIKFIDLGVNYRGDDNVPFAKKKKNHKERLSRELVEEKADICISMYCEDVGIVPDIQDGSKKIMEFHFAKSGSKIKTLTRYVVHSYRSWKMDRLAKKYDRVVLLTEKDCINWKIKNKCVIPNAVMIRGEEPAGLKNKMVIAVGRYVYQKGLESMLEAWSKVPACLIEDGWKLRLVGSGELEKKYRAIAADLGITSSVILGKSESDMPKVYNEASIMALTSVYEGLPLALIEAQSFGIPVVSFDCNCGPSDIIDNGETGYLVEPGDTNGLAQKLTVLMKNEGLRKEMGAKAYEVSKRFLPEVIMGKWVNLFNEVVNG